MRSGARVPGIARQSGKRALNEVGINEIVIAVLTNLKFIANAVNQRVNLSAFDAKNFDRVVRWRRRNLMSSDGKPDRRTGIRIVAETNRDGGKDLALRVLGAFDVGGGYCGTDSICILCGIVVRARRKLK